MLIDILAIPLEFIKENLTGWVILIFIIIIIYFVALRNYYLQKERFYDQAIFEKNIKNIEDTEENILASENKDKSPAENTTANNKNSKYNKNNNREEKQSKRAIQHSNKIDKKFKQNFSQKLNNNNKKSLETRIENNIKKVFEGFENNIPTTGTTTSSAVQNDLTMYISTTLFDNLNLNPAQIQSCKLNYNDVIANSIVEIGKLTKMQSSNRFLNTAKQFDLIIAKGIDNIIGYLNNNVKSFNTLTRTTIRNDVINTLTTTIENLIDKTNKTLVEKLNRLASLNSTTIDYNTQLEDITEIRANLEEYIAIDKLVGAYSHKDSLSQKEVSSILDKSYLLPIYERNFDKIRQLVNSDFNQQENNLADKYSKAYMDFLEQKKKEDLDVNPLRLASQIESGIVSLLSTYKSPSTSSNTGSDDWRSEKEVVEQYTREFGYTDDSVTDVRNNPIPVQEKNLFDGVKLNESNILSDIGNRGSYMINKKAQGDILEGFQTKEDNTGGTENTPSANNMKRAIMNNANIKSSNSNNANKVGNVDLIGKLMSGDFLQYTLDIVYSKFISLMALYNIKMGNGNYSGDGESGFKLEDNMIPAGLLLFVISMLLYFVDITSS